MTVEVELGPHPPEQHSVETDHDGEEPLAANGDRSEPLAGGSVGPGGSSAAIATAAGSEACAVLQPGLGGRG